MNYTLAQKIFGAKKILDQKRSGRIYFGKKIVGPKNIGPKQFGNGNGRFGGAVYIFIVSLFLFLRGLIH